MTWPKRLHCANWSSLTKTVTAQIDDRDIPL